MEKGKIKGERTVESTSIVWVGPSESSGSRKEDKINRSRINSWSRENKYVDQWCGDGKVYTDFWVWNLDN